jgi:hypothetical protein
MTRSWRVRVTGLLVLVPLSSTAQRPPNFSGDWVLISVTTSGAGRRGGAEPSNASGERRITSNTASGAAFNYGRECTIVHNGQTMTIDKALLAPETAAAAAVTLQMDGRQAPVVDSFSRGRKIPATAKWTGDKLEITSPTGSIAITQVLSIEAAELGVVTSVSLEGNTAVTSKYRRK